MRRKFSADGVMHIYQRTISGFNLFYSVEDFLVLYTIVAVQVRRTSSPCQYELQLPLIVCSGSGYYEKILRNTLSQDLSVSLFQDWIRPDYCLAMFSRISVSAWMFFIL